MSRHDSDKDEALDWYDEIIQESLALYDNCSDKDLTEIYYQWEDDGDSSRRRMLLTQKGADVFVRVGCMNLEEATTIVEACKAQVGRNKEDTEAIAAILADVIVLDSLCDEILNTKTDESKPTVDDPRYKLLNTTNDINHLSAEFAASAWYLHNGDNGAVESSVSQVANALWSYTSAIGEAYEYDQVQLKALAEIWVNGLC